jgi:hypothetical protein
VPESFLCPSVKILLAWTISPCNIFFGKRKTAKERKGGANGVKSYSGSLNCFKRQKEGLGGSSMVECMPTLYEAPGSIPSTKEGREKEGRNRRRRDQESSMQDFWGGGQLHTFIGMSHQPQQSQSSEVSKP